MDWLVTFGEVPAYSATLEGVVVWNAESGQWYLEQLVEGGYALSVLDQDAAAMENDSPVWFLIQEDPVGLEGLRICG